MKFVPLKSKLKTLTCHKVSVLKMNVQSRTPRELQIILLWSSFTQSLTQVDCNVLSSAVCLSYGDLNCCDGMFGHAITARGALQLARIWGIRASWLRLTEKNDRGGKTVTTTTWDVPKNDGDETASYADLRTIIGVKVI